MAEVHVFPETWAWFGERHRAERSPLRPRTTDQHRQHHRRDLACVSRPLFGRCRIFSGANPRPPRCGRIEHLAGQELLDQTAV
jgi:hypothetical protein